MKKWTISAVIGKILYLPRRIYRSMESRRYEKGSYAERLHILNTDETLDLIEKEKISFLRYGDCEIAIMNGESIPFQSYDENLAGRLKAFLKTDKKELKIGIPYYYMHPVKNLNDFVAKFAKTLSGQRKFLCEHCSKKITYIDTAITQVYQTYEKYDFKRYYERMQNLLRDRDITVICGEGVLDKLEYKAYDVCKTVTIITAPKKNAYAEYEKILAAALKTDPQRLVCVILGPTAKVLVCDLHERGYQAWDMGHYFKDYDAYMKKRPRTDEEITRFYKPD